ncbi:CHAT domain-containing protein [Acrocarpospora catenulata]|uniref:CHAT domain-containing protein n=1 Tax=Acrocarpospora catenulata TaxID=2836182 RepID=UPI001BDB56D2|nr:CHAT domain-containing protein [Acrocarpospora catenulata]
MSVPDGGLVARAEWVVELAGRDPRLAREVGEEVLRAAGEAGEAASVALRGLALAAWELGELALADELLGRAAEVAAGHPVRAAQAGMSRVSVRALLGDPEGGLALADAVEGDLAGIDGFRLDVQRAVPLILLSRHEEAVQRCTRALDGLGGDARFRAGALLNRGLAGVFLERYGEAVADLSEAAGIARAAGFSHLAMLAEGNLPFAAAKRGDIAAAFESYQIAERALLGFPERLAAMRTDLAQALVAARLPGEARVLLEQAIPDLATSGAHAVLSEARLLLAEVELLMGDTHQAVETARSAESDLHSQSRPRWAPLAREVAVRARLAQALHPDHKAGAIAAARLLREVFSCADDLLDNGWPANSDSLRLTGAVAARRRGDRAAAVEQLSRLLGPRTRPIVRHHAQALLHHLNGNDRAALHSVETGIAAFVDSLSRPSSVPRPVKVASTAERVLEEVRVHAVRGAEDLAAFGLELALGTGDGWAVLAWAERWRASVRGAPEDGLPNSLRKTRTCLVELVRHQDDLYALVVHGGDCRLHPLGSYAAVTEQIVRVRYGLRRRNLRDAPTNPESLLARELTSLDTALLEPLDLPPGPITLIPTGALHTLPWPMLPSLLGRPVSVTSHAGEILPTAQAHDPRVVAVAGPGLRHAMDEVDAVVAIHRDARSVKATKSDVIEALGHATILHVAAHGMFSPRSPLLSRITLDDEPLMAYELLRVPRVPDLVILSACDAGMAHAPADGVALGLAGAFLDRGARCVIAGVVPVRDDEALTLMRCFHELLAAGRTPAEALAEASVKTGVPGFTCFGAGDRPIVRGRTPDQPVATGRSGSVIQWDQEPT